LRASLDAVDAPVRSPLWPLRRASAARWLRRAAQITSTRAAIPKIRVFIEVSPLFRPDAGLRMTG
jgi:hypothetical protein